MGEDSLTLQVAPSKRGEKGTEEAMIRIYVEAHEDCQTCEGSGVVSNHGWLQLTAQHPDWYALPTPEWNTLVEAFFRDAGYSSMPSEEESCGDCEGLGKTITKMLLEDALKLVAVEIR